MDSSRPIVDMYGHANDKFLEAIVKEIDATMDGVFQEGESADFYKHGLWNFQKEDKEKDTIRIQKILNSLHIFETLMKASDGDLGDDEPVGDVVKLNAEETKNDLIDAGKTPTKMRVMKLIGAGGMTMPQELALSSSSLAQGYCSVDREINDTYKMNTAPTFKFKDAQLNTQRQILQSAIEADSNLDGKFKTYQEQLKRDDLSNEERTRIVDKLCKLSRSALSAPAAGGSLSTTPDFSDAYDNTWPEMCRNRISGALQSVKEAGKRASHTLLLGLTASSSKPEAQKMISRALSASGQGVCDRISNATKAAGLNVTSPDAPANVKPAFQLETPRNTYFSALSKAANDITELAIGALFSPFEDLETEFMELSQIQDPTPNDNTNEIKSLNEGESLDITTESSSTILQNTEFTEAVLNGNMCLAPSRDLREAEPEIASGNFTDADMENIAPDEFEAVRQVLEPLADQMANSELAQDFTERSGKNFSLDTNNPVTSAVCQLGPIVRDVAEDAINSPSLRDVSMANLFNQSTVTRANNMSMQREQARQAATSTPPQADESSPSPPGDFEEQVDTFFDAEDLEPGPSQTSAPSPPSAESEEGQTPAPAPPSAPPGPEPEPSSEPDPTPAPIPEPTPAPTPAPETAPPSGPDPTPAPVPEPTPAPTPAPRPPSAQPRPAPTPAPRRTPTSAPTPAPRPPPSPRTNTSTGSGGGSGGGGDGSGDGSGGGGGGNDFSSYGPAIAQTMGTLAALLTNAGFTGNAISYVKKLYKDVGLDGVKNYMAGLLGKSAPAPGSGGGPSSGTLAATAMSALALSKASNAEKLAMGLKNHVGTNGYEDWADIHFASFGIGTGLTDNDWAEILRS